MPNATQPLCGEILSLLRRMKGTKQRDAAKKAGLSQQYYSQIEQGKKNLSEEAYNNIITCNKYTAEEIEIVKKFFTLPYK